MTPTLFRQTFLDKYLLGPIKSSKYFELTDFTWSQSVEQKSSSSAEHILITLQFRPNPEFKLLFKYFALNKGEYHWTAMPGRHFVKESASSTNRDDLINTTSNWLTDLWNELNTGPISRHLNESQKRISELVEQIESMNEEELESFNLGDAEQRINDLEELLMTHIEASELEQKQRDEQIAILERDVDFLRRTVSTMSKKGWLMSFVSRAGKWATTEEGTKLLTETVKLVNKALPESTCEH